MRVVSSVLFCIIVITVSAAMYVVIMKEKKSNICYWELDSSITVRYTVEHWECFLIISVCSLVNLHKRHQKSPVTQESSVRMSVKSTNAERPWH